MFTEVRSVFMTTNEYRKKIISKLKNHRMTIEDLVDDLGIDIPRMEKEIKSMERDHIQMDITKKRGSSKTYYHINMNPDVGNVYHISGKTREPKHMKFGASSDWHFSSKYHLKRTWHDAMTRAEDEGYKRIYVAGDLIDGRDIYRGHNENINSPSVEDQTDEVAEAIRKHGNLEFWGIAGNHDFSFTKKTGTKPLAILESKVDNFKNLGDLRADVVYNGVKIRLLHGGAGRTYAISYPSQTYLRDLFRGSEKKEILDMPDMMILGHFHTIYDSKDHGIYILQPGSFQDGDNEYCLRRGLTGPNGMYLVDFDYKNGLIDEFATKYIQPKVRDLEKGQMHAKTSRSYR